MSWQNILAVVLLTAAYGGISAALGWLLRRAGAPARWTIVLGALAFGIGSGLLAAWVWPYDSCVLPNLWAVLLGDAVYQWSSENLGDPAVLRVPWVYAWAGTILYGALGLAAQAIANLWRWRASSAARSDNPNVQA